METGHAPLALDAILPMIGDGARVLVARALGVESSNIELVDPALSVFMQRYSEKPVVHTTLLAGARAALALELPSALVTNKPRAITMLVLAALGIADSFGAVFAGGDGPLKPSPFGIEKVVSELGVSIDQAWLVGDGPQDVLAGRAAGCFTVAVPGIAERERVLAAGPHLVLSSLDDLPAAVGASSARA